MFRSTVRFPDPTIPEPVTIDRSSDYRWTVNRMA